MSADDLREQLAKALLADALARVNEPDPDTVEEIQDDYRKTADALLPIVTAHVAAERERAVAEVVEQAAAALEREAPSGRWLAANVATWLRGFAKGDRR